MSACAIRTIRSAISSRAIARRNWRKCPISSSSISIPSRCKPTEFRLYSERVIHGEIYKARPEVNAVVPSPRPCGAAVRHFRASEMVPVFHLGAVDRPGAVLGPARRVRRHQHAGDQAGGRRFAGARARAALDGADAPPRRHRRRHSLRELTFRTVFGCDNAKLLSQAMAHGHVDSLSRGRGQADLGAPIAPAVRSVAPGIIGCARSRRPA